MRILCVDDDEDTGFLLQTYLANWHLEAVAVTTMPEALRLMAQEQFNLYIIDGGLPGVSGPDFCASIRKLDKTTPIVFFTGNGYEADRAAGLEAGANAYIVKPDLKAVVPIVQQLLAKARAVTA